MEILMGEDDFARQMADELNMEFVKVNTSIFPDSEIKPLIENEDKIKGNKVLLVIRTDRFRPSINDSIMKIYFICRTLQKAEEINLFLPYMFYSRQDKKFLPGEPESFSDIAQFYENLGIKNIFTVNSHLYGKEKTLQDYFKQIKIHDISPSKLFAGYLKTKDLKNPIVLGPGAGPAVMVKELAEMLNAPYECLVKERNHKTQQIFMKSPNTDLKYRDVIIYDDVAASGGTIIRAFKLTKKFKPNRIFIVVSHLLTKGGIKKLYRLRSDEIITTDSFNSEEKGNFTEISLIPLFKLLDNLRH
jgi:ribose-phosphate pyrophosphokinase